jgi:hypothetical protein
MFAVFYKGQFINWWLNRVQGDGDWIERTIRAMSWNADDVEVIWMEQVPQGNDVWTITPNKELVLHEPVELVVDDETKPGKTKKVSGFKTRLKITGTVHFKNGQRQIKLKEG